ncbi:MAG: RNA polymerase sigma factor [Thermomicrobiales bacterium]
MIALAKRGEVPAYEALVRRYQTLAFRTAYLITRDAAAAEDAAQTAFIKAWKAIDRFELETERGQSRLSRRRRSLPVNPEPSFRPWLLTIVANEARNRLRSDARHPTIELNEAIDHPLTTDTESPEAVVESNERQAELMRALEQLSESDRTVVSMRYFLDLSEQEMAAALGIPPGTVKSRLSRALKRTRAHLLAMNTAPGNQESAND